MIAAGIGDGTLNIYNVASGRRLFKLASGSARPSPVTACSFKTRAEANEPQVIIAAESSGLVTYYNAFRGQRVSSFQVRTEPEHGEEPQDTEVYTLRLNADGTAMVLAGKDGVVRVYDTQIQRQVVGLRDGNGRTTAGHSNRVFSACFHDRDFSLVYSAGWDQTVQVWDLRAGISVQSLHGAKVYGDGLDVRDATLAVGNHDVERQVQLYDLRQPTEPVLQASITFEYPGGGRRPVQDFDQGYLEKIREVNRQLVLGVARPDDDGAPEARPPLQDELPAQQPPRTDEALWDDEPTLVYDCKFGRTRDTLVAGGSGGREVRVYRRLQLAGAWRAPQAVYACATSRDGRFGAAAGNGFGVQVFGLDDASELT